MPTLLRILFLEDRQPDLELVQRHLHDNGLVFTPQWVTNEVDYLARLKDFDPDVILADYALPQYDGLSALESARQFRPETPFIFVSGTMGEDIAVESLRRGATDYVLKGNLARLAPAVHRALREKSEERRRREAEETLRRSELHFRLLYEESPVAYHSLNRDGHILNVNDAWLALLGYTRAETLGRAFTEFLDPTQVDLFHERFPRFMKTGALSGTEYSLRRKDGGTVIVSEDARASVDAEGHFRHSHCVLHDITRRKQAEEALRASERSYREIFNASTDLIILHDNETGAILDANQAALEFFECTRSDIRQRTLGDLGNGHSPHAQADALTWIRQAVAAGPQVFEWRVRNRNGAPRWLEIALRSTDIGGKGRVLAVLRDITERKQAQEALATERNLLRVVTDNVPDYIYIKDLQGRFLFVNAAHLRLFQVTRFEDILQRTVFDFFPAETARRFSDDDELILRTGKALHNRMEAFTDAHGQRRWLFTTKVPLRDATGQVTGLAGISRDVTESRLAEEAMRQSQQRLALHVQQTRLGVIEWDLDFRVTAWNPAAERIFGFTAEEAIGRLALDLIVPASARAQVTAVWNALLKQQGGSRSTHENVTKEGRSILCEWYNTPLVDATGRVIAAASQCWDVTERREAEATRLRLEAQLRQAQKMEAVGQLAGGVAHDFNNLLTVILGNANLLLNESGLNPEALELAGQVDEAAERASGLTRQLLAFSRQQVMQMRSVDLNELLGQLTKMLSRLLGAQIVLQCQYQPGLPPIKADAGMIEQVVLNLALNARDAMPQGGELRIVSGVATLSEEQAELNTEARAGPFVVLSVTDTGTGIGPEIKSRLFEPFFTTKEVGKGSGLGLATAYGILKQHNGWIEVESQLGHGSTFRLYFPPGETVAVERPTKEAPSAIRGGHETILVVEDEPTVRRLVVTCLQRYGYRVHAAANGPEALRIWTRLGGEIDLVVTDLIMPEGMSGYDLAGRLRKDQPKVKMIFTSGYSQEVLSTDPDFLKDDLYLTKPFKPTALARVVRQRLDTAIQPAFPRSPSTLNPH